MIVKKQYIPKRYRSKKLVNSGGGVAVGGSFTLGDQVDTSAFLLADKFTSLFEYDEVNDAIKAKLPLYSEGEISAYGYGGSGGSGGSDTIYNLHQLAGESISSSPADKSRLEYNAITGKWENRSGLDLSVYATKTELNAGLSSIAWSSITGEPTTLLEYGITDAVTSADFTAHVNSNLHLTAGQRTLLANTTAYFTAELEAKLIGIAEEANNYTHPATHAPSIIAQDANNRFVTDSNIASWNAKEPAITKGTTAQYFRGDMSLALFPTALPASDVSDWAKESVKPTYVWSEIGNKPTTLSDYGITDALLASAYTAADVLTKLKTVDGHLSGLDADTVDGKHVATSGWWDKLAYIGADGVMEVGVHIDFHELSTGGADYAGRLSCYGGSPLWSGNAMYYALNANRTDVNWAAATLTAQTDILTPFNTWTHATDKNSLKKFLELFDIDAAGNLVVNTNLYSMGEVTAYSSGTGVSGLKLMGDLDANEKEIINVGAISSLYGLALNAGGTNWFILGDDGIHSMYGEYEGLTSLSAVNLFASSRVTAPEFKFGNYSFKQSANGLSICFNGVEQAYITNTGQYVNS